LKAIAERAKTSGDGQQDLWRGFKQFDASIGPPLVKNAALFRPARP